MFGGKKIPLIALLGLAISLFPASAQERETPVSANSALPPGGSRRGFDDIFPGLGDSRKTEAFSEKGLLRSLGKNEPLEFIAAPDSGVNLHSEIMKSKPSYLAESLLVLPYAGRSLDRLDAYNAAGRIGDLKGRLYHSFTRQAEVPLFENATRLESAEKNISVPDPPPAKELPLSETIYMRLKDVNFGNTYYRADISATPFGISCKLANFRTISYLLFTVMKAEKFSAILYLEPLAEGMLVYSVAGTDASDFIASRISIPSAIEKRLAVFTGWISDGLKAAEQTRLTQ